MPGDHAEEQPSIPADRIAATTPLDEARVLNEEELKRLPKRTLVTLARDESLPQRSKMNKAQLARTLRKHFRGAKSELGCGAKNESGRGTKSDLGRKAR